MYRRKTDLNNENNAEVASCKVSLNLSGCNTLNLVGFYNKISKIDRF